MAEQQQQNLADINGTNLQGNQNQLPVATGTQPESCDSLSGRLRVTTDTPFCQSSSTNDQDNVQTSEMLSVDDSDDYLMNFEAYLTNDTSSDTSLIHSIIYRTPPASPANTAQVQPTVDMNANHGSNSNNISGRRCRRRYRRRRTGSYRDHSTHEQDEEGRSSVSSRYVLHPLNPPVPVDGSLPSLPIIPNDIQFSDDPVRSHTVRMSTHIHIYIYIYITIYYL